MVLTEDGIVEEGTHDTLLEQRGIYYHFYVTANELK
jgi:ATP-binding cassette subfamily B protein